MSQKHKSGDMKWLGRAESTQTHMLKSNTCVHTARRSRHLSIIPWYCSGAFFQSLDAKCCGHGR